MMKVNIFAALCAAGLGISALVAAESPAKFQLPVIRNYSTEDEVRVAVTGSVSRIPGGNRKASEDAPGKSAALLDDTGALWQWEPSPLTDHATGGADLTDAALSPDESAAVMVERVGGSDAPNSSRLIFVSLRSGRILRIVELAKRRITAVK